MVAHVTGGRAEAVQVVKGRGLVPAMAATVVKLGIWGAAALGGGRGDSSPTRLEEVGEGDRGAGGGEARGCAASTADGAGGAIGPQRDTWRPMLRIADDPSRVKVVLHIMLFRTRFSIFSFLPHISNF
jgi:hypothetical protein